MSGAIGCYHLRRDADGSCPECREANERMQRMLKEIPIRSWRPCSTCDALRSEVSALRERAEAAERMLDAVAFELDDFGPARVGQTVAECVAAMRDRLSQRVAEIEGREGWREREAAALRERDEAREALREVLDHVETWGVAVYTTRQSDDSEEIIMRARRVLAGARGAGRGGER